MATSQLLNRPEGQVGYEESSQKFEAILPTLPKGKGWWLQHLYQYHGFWFQSESGLKGLIHIHNHFKPRLDDVILASYPKCGTTWLRALIFATTSRASYDFSSHPLLSENPRTFVPFLEAAIYRHKSTAPLEALPSPRLFATHIPYTLFPDYMKDSVSGCRFVYVCRDPKDVLVSKWFFMNNLRPKELPPMSFQDAFDLFCEGVSHYGPFWDHVYSCWNAASSEAAGKVLFLTYEDMKRDPVLHVKRLATFLGMPFSEEEENRGVVQQVVKLCSFENLSTLEINKSLNSSNNVKNPYLFRKGQVGDWKNHFTPDMAAHLDKITKEKLPDYTQFGSLWMNPEELV